MNFWCSNTLFNGSLSITKVKKKNYKKIVNSYIKPKEPDKKMKLLIHYKSKKVKKSNYKK